MSNALCNWLPQDQLLLPVYIDSSHSYIGKYYCSRDTLQLSMQEEGGGEGGGGEVASKQGRAVLTTATWLKLLIRKMVPSFLVLKVRGSCMSRSIQAYLMRSKL